MTVTNDKQREERYKEALKTCDCRVWVSMIKALYLRKQDRIEHKKKVTDLDERYFSHGRRLSGFRAFTCS